MLSIHIQATIATIITTVSIVDFIMAVSITNQGIYNVIVCIFTKTGTLGTVLLVYAGSTAVSTIEVTIFIIGFIIAIAVSRFFTVYFVKTEKIVMYMVSN